MRLSERLSGRASISAEPFARKLEKGSADVSAEARDLMLFLASIASMARSHGPPPRHDER
jgi:hypothetical protein